MPDKSLSQVPRELASNWVYKVHAWRGRSPEFMQAQVSRLEAVIREAMQKALEEARNATCALCKKDTPIVNYDQQHRLKKSCTPVEFYYVDCLAAAIRSLIASSLTEQETTK